VRISKVEYVFADKNFKFEFNSNSEEDNNTYSLILGNNGSGKSTFFEVLLGKFSEEYDSKEPSSVELEEGSLKKIILSTYSPFDRISNKTLRESSRVFFKIKSKKNEKKVEEGTDQKNTEVIYPIHTHDKIISLACSSYYKCIIKNDRHFANVEKAVSNLLELDSSNKLFLIESINQAKIRKLFSDAISSYNNDVYKKVHERISYIEQSEQILIKSFVELMYKRNELFDEIYGLFNAQKKSEEYEEIVVNYLNTEFIPRFSDKKIKTEDYYKKTDEEFLKFITRGQYFNYEFYSYPDILLRVKKLADIREKMFKTLDKLNELEDKGKSYFTYHGLNNYFFKFVSCLRELKPSSSAINEPTRKAAFSFTGILFLSSVIHIVILSSSLNTRPSCTKGQNFSVLTVPKLVFICSLPNSFSLNLYTSSSSKIISKETCSPVLSWSILG